MNFLQRIAALHSTGPYRAERVTAETALPGSDTPVLPNPRPHLALGTPLIGAEEWGQRAAEAFFGMGCFWGAERILWQVPGVLSTAAGYAGGWTRNPTYRQVCTGGTGHAEVVRVVYDPATLPLERLLAVAMENHNPCLGDRQGNDIGTQYRSAIYLPTPADLDRARRALATWEPRFIAAGHGELTTELGLLSSTGILADASSAPSTPPAHAEVAGDGRFYLAEAEHQQYLVTHPQGYCNHGPNGVECPTGVLGRED